MLYISIFLAFVLGFIFGIGAILAWSLIKLKRIDDKLKASLPKATVFKKIDPSVKDRLNKAFDITERQLGILGALDMPQSGPLHGKHKNQLNSELKSLEDQKLNLLRSVLDDGYNPTLTILNADTNVKEKILLSEFLSRYEGQHTANTSQQQPPEPKAKPKLKLISKKDEDK